MERVYELLEKIAPMKKEIMERCLAYIEEQLKKAKDNSISFRDEDNEPIKGMSVVVTYDGGNHPEYAANPYSEVYGVYMKNGKIYIDCEDCDEYNIEYATYGDIVDIADFMYDILELK